MTTRGRAARRFRRSCKMCVRLLKRGKSHGARERVPSKPWLIAACGGALVACPQGPVLSLSN